MHTYRRTGNCRHTHMSAWSMVQYTVSPLCLPKALARTSFLSHPIHHVSLLLSLTLHHSYLLPPHSLQHLPSIPPISSPSPSPCHVYPHLTHLRPHPCISKSPLHSTSPTVRPLTNTQNKPSQTSILTCSSQRRHSPLNPCNSLYSSSPQLFLALSASYQN